MEPSRRNFFALRSTNNNVRNSYGLRPLPLHLRKTHLAQLLRGRPNGIFIAPFELGEIGPDLFRAACNMGLEALASKRRDRAYRGSRQPHWIKVRNRTHPAMAREF
jgi:ATP-dependent DNA ligase